MNANRDSIRSDGDATTRRNVGVVTLRWSLGGTSTSNRRNPTTTFGREVTKRPTVKRENLLLK